MPNRASTEAHCVFYQRFTRMWLHFFICLLHLIMNIKIQQFCVVEEILRIEVTSMTYKTIVIDYAPKAKEMAAAIERTANERAQEGWELMTFSVTNSAKAILVFRLPNAAQQQGKPIPEEIDNETR